SMASTLLSNLNSEAQYQANILTNTPVMIKVMVEYELDVYIWQKILSHFAPAPSFEITPYSYDPEISGKGKAQILMSSGNFGPYLIGCVDSDLDWLLQKWTPDGITIAANPYILQTYAYSIENLAAQPAGKSDMMLEVTLHSCDFQRDIDSIYEHFITLLSSAIYDVVLWHLVIRKQPDPDSIQQGWNYILKKEHYQDISNDRHLSARQKLEAILARLNQRATELNQTYNQHYSHLITERCELAEYLGNEYNLSTVTAYLFVRGHDLQAFLLHNFFEPLKNELFTLHEKEIRTHCTQSTEIENAIKHYHKIRKRLDSIYLTATAYLHQPGNPLNTLIQADITKIL
ncbi:MAG: DUF4435 domain-containing protein, partial [Muribaculaceae bacterium]|nr:DUF4435 domain-containing protein [Muribaculaceae bacterium]